MKRIILPIFLILAILMTFVACDHKESDQSNETGSNSEQTMPTPEVTKTTYDILNELASKSYSQIELNISTATGDIELMASYVLTNTEVTYAVEQLNLLPSDGNIENISPDHKVTLSGSATLENGRITKIDGEAVSLPSYDELTGAFNFTENNFRNVRKDHGKIAADVISASEFLEIDKTINDMRITVEYSSSALQKITITYNTINSAVEMVYEFEE